MVVMSIYFIRCLDRISSSEIVRSLLAHFSPDAVGTGEAPDATFVDPRNGGGGMFSLFFVLFIINPKEEPSV